MNYILFDDSTRKNLLPLTFTRPICELRVGILTIREKWEKYLDAKVSFLTENYLLEKYSLIKKNDNILINGSVIPTKEMVKQISILKRKEAIVTDDYIIAIRLDEEDLKDMHDSGSEKMKGTDSPDSNGLIYKKYNKNHTRISFPWQIFKNNQQEIENDFTLITEGRKSQPISKTNTVFNAENIFIEEGARVECAILNAENGPIYVGENAEIMEGAIIRGALALCNNSTIKMGAKIYGATTFGPHVKIGGEVNNSVFLGYANKAHDGFVGNSVIGEWCNLGADTNTSNLKNTYEEVRLWSYVDKSFSNTGEQFVGLIMGDHSKCGINTMFNTGSVVGVNSNVFGDGYQRNFIPSFMWGGKSGYSKYSYAKAVKVAKVVYNRRNMEFNKIEQNIFKTIFNKT
ncbi:MAG: putative sugar nucleotidyl transferase, partial [Bacteroidota bacterium]|nr:putative sugar nucleotidyl transferase [Bacteroidota bacterium]